MSWNILNKQGLNNMHASCIEIVILSMLANLTQYGQGMAGVDLFDSLSKRIRASIGGNLNT